MATIKIPVFCRASNISVLEQALTEGVLVDIDRICWAYISDDGTLAYVDPNKNIHKIKGDNKVVVQKVDALPSVADGDTEVLYVLDDVVYTFNGTEFKPSFYEVKIELDALKTQVESIDTRLDITEGNVASLQETLANLGVTVNAVQAELTNKADKSDVYTKDNVDTLLATKADSADVYGRDYIDNALSGKADADEVYSKTEIDTALAEKADKEQVYTKSEVDAMVNVDIPGGETITVVQYVNQSAENAVEESKRYTDEAIQIHFV